MMSTRSAALLAVPESKLSVLVDLFSLTKPRLSSLVIFTSALGLFLAPGSMSYWQIFVAILATSGLVGGACVINCYMEKEIDAKMERTSSRPLPSGRLSSELALSFGLGLITVCLLALWMTINTLTAALGFTAAVVYIFLYTPMKRKTSWALFAGAIPGAIPPLMGWTAMSGEVSAMGWALFGILFVWQLPHFLSISMYHMEDYKKADIKIFPVLIGMRGTLHRIVIWTFVLWAVSLTPYFLGFAHEGYLVLSCLVGAFFSVFALRGYRHQVDSPELMKWSRGYFYGSLVYLPVIFIGLLIFK